ncbi:MAG: Hsp20 family protein [Alphaproteobacteria bacterium]|nr:Hsp20 family protein [Alphaproteobacteria bacterium]
MRTYDLSPLFRATVGFDRLSPLFESAFRGANENGYPPYNIEKTGEHAYRVTMAVAGFKADEIDVTFESNQLTISGGKGQAAEEQRQYLHRGIATRSFQQKFHLADHIRVAEARLENGLLEIELVEEVPEELKPRKIAIKGSGATVIEQRKAA